MLEVARSSFTVPFPEGRAPNEPVRFAAAMPGPACAETAARRTFCDDARFPETQLHHRGT
jgi:hypothetical protein